VDDGRPWRDIQRKPLPGTTTHALQLCVNLPASEKRQRRATGISEGKTFPRDGSRLSRYAFYPAAPGAFPQPQR